MREPFLPPAPHRRSDRPAWFVVAGFAAVLLSLCVASAVNYSSIVVAQVTVSIVPSYVTSFAGTGPDGVLSPNGTVSARVSVRVDNPSGRVLHLKLFAYSGWIEDGPAEAGLNESRRLSDDRLVGPNGARYFFRVFGLSMEVEGMPVPASGNETYSFTFNLTRAENPQRFDTVQNITEHARDVGGDPARIPWNHWVRIQLAIDGVPAASSPTAAPYLLTIGRIEREEGTNLAR